MREQEVWAWSDHESSGAKFRSVSVIREGAEDNAYFIVERDGRFFVEYQVRRKYGDPVQNAFFVDCGLAYNDPDNPVTRVSGLDHLIGKEVIVLADGSVVRGLTVQARYEAGRLAEGYIELPSPAGVIAAGLPYSMKVETLDPEIRTESGVIDGEKRNVFRIVISVRETRGLKSGPSYSQLKPVKFDVPDYYNAPPPLYSGEIELVLPGSHRKEASIVLTQDEPLPCTILALTSCISVG